ncbi:leucine-rich repeat and immunoglobulin-like domain-containing nogo receptor-interacting protein 1 [Carcharodon carcharias]|uniref:leucine-rich repeat and immunoglobulin-like domain-containing nogo receptor-interacting protein 1 n=1 Tax=Carcharodon carcharias TaxID=13397 RepID=UPI001B7DC24A|nr:leucine-rich repeat and immunoglobulin-like domain-containing nogo receptor-interacting protein 1 [Carcharodon carcharias]
MLTGAGPRAGSRLLLLLLLLLTPGLGCPSQCRCWPLNRTVSCSGRGLEAVPRGIPAGTRALDLRGNRLRYLAPGALSGLAALDRLELAGNPLLVLLDHTFRGLGRLSRLELGGPQLSYVGPRAWAGLGGLQQLTLEGAALRSPPAAALAALANLTALRLRRLPNVAALPGRPFRSLGRLRLLELDAWASLASLGPDSLLGLNLLWLSVTRCNLSAVPYASLRSQAYLRSLDLSHNPIGDIRAPLLQHVTRLEELRLVGARLVRVEPGAFRGLVRFRLLDVSANRLPSLPQSAFRSAAALQSLGLGRNPLACDCRLLWVARRRRRLRFLEPGPTCASPERLRGRRLAELGDTLPGGSFTCRRPRIRDKRPQRLRAREGESVTFRCSADGQPDPDILWLNPRRQRLGGPGLGSGPAVGRSRLLANGSLEIASVRLLDAGTYLCVARNAGGNDTASAWLQVRPLSPQELGLLGPTDRAPRAGLRPGYPFDTQTLLVATTMGFASFFTVVTVCFTLLSIWSRASGPIKHNNIQVDFVPHGGGSGGGGGDGGEEAQFNMKMV